MKAEINIEVLERLLKGYSSSKLLKKSIEIFGISKKNAWQKICLYIISLVMACFVGISAETANIMADSVETILNIILALFGIVFTGYAFFQALINNELLIRLMVDTFKDEKRGYEISRLQETNESFVECMMLNIIAVLVSLVLKIIVSCIPEEFLLVDTLVYNNLLAIFLISIYYFFIVTIIWEIKSFVFNIFQLFNAYAGTRVLNLLNNKNSGEE